MPLSSEQAWLRPFHAWAELMDYALTGNPVYYKAPMDLRAHPVRVAPLKRVIRVYPYGFHRRGHRPFDPFSADRGHLDRFYRPIEDQWGRRR